MKTEQLTPNFNISEFRCHDGTDVPNQFECNVKELAKNLQILRDYLGQPIHVNSGYRTPSYNATLEGSAQHSQHMLAKAADIVTAHKTPKEMADIIEQLIKEGKMKQGGLGRYKGFTHYDVRGTKARWGKN